MQLTDENLQELLNEDLNELFSSIRKHNISAPNAVKEFAQTTPDGGTWRYLYTGNLRGAKNFVHAFRSELSRIRERMRDVGKPLILFRVTSSFHEIKSGEHKGKILISLKRSAKELEAMRAMDDIMDAFSYRPESAQ